MTIHSRCPHIARNIDAAVAVQERQLQQTRSQFIELKKGASEEASTLKHMLDKTKNRLETANEIGANRAATLTRILAQFKRPGALQAMRVRQHARFVTLTEI
eukprot:COSAG05_NODE_195_length_14550_cov_203.233686_4_plen_102_part_00